jgi:hypothetical protein
MSCGDCGKPFVVGDTPHAAAPPESRPHSAAVRETAAAALPTARPVAAARPARELTLPPPDDGPGAGRKIVIAVCVLFLLILLGGVGYLIMRAPSGGDWRGTTIAPALRDRRDRGPDDEGHRWRDMQLNEDMRALEAEELRKEVEDREREIREKRVKEDAPKDKKKD